ncbi:BTAD domain-containing putative transcriptional regulator [Micromonospora sp. WMMD812]|uniref:AfsR/SARP family transcriptional regulator n=1 Tax=Micromonospora sp. WMMD812 TaxID=3015152 RepID=UPI00248A9912|nr:BTAD domain-containing putative transcriptional regulator [Micromonospora sp. WMMD812]WBB65815.1 BTAD domain-containing putative transcriptional regulator [Micromonospora sp. WMMD812]
MKIRVLGDFVVQLATHTLHLGTPKQRAVLALLAVQPGHVVTVDELVDELWPDTPPRSAIPNVRSYAANLRRIFESAGQKALVRQGAGYRLDLEPDRVDLACFEAEFRRAQEALRGDDGERAAGLLTRAVARWQGPMLAGVPLGPALSARAVAAEEERVLATELLGRVHVAAGRQELAIPLLRELLALHPLREPAYLLLMRALHRHGDRAGAFAAYDAAWTALRRELGIEPGTELRRFRQAIDTSGSVDRAAAPVPSPRESPAFRESPASRAWPSSRDSEDRERSGLESSPDPPGVRGADWLPRAVTDFVGRAASIERLLAETRRVEARLSAVHVIDGMAGSGKTTLAVHVARRLAARYADAQLFIDLRGHGGAAPVDPAAALATLLTQLGVPGQQVPAELAYRGEAWRRELARRRCVVVLDNAASGEQVLPLLPVLPGTVVIVTSRRRLTGLDVGPPESLPVMTSEEGLELLARSAGPERVAAEPGAAAAVVRRCGHLPLAIRLAGSRLARRRSWRLADLADMLADGVHASGQLSAEERTLGGVFATSYEPLSPPAKTVFRLLSLHPGGRVSLTMAAALAGLPLGSASRAVDELVDGHLIEEVAADRYRMHDLIRQYSSELSVRTDSAGDRRSALTELLDFVVHAALRAAELLEPDFIREQAALAPPRRPDLLAAAAAPSIDWLERERAELVALVVCAQEKGHHPYAWRLARITWRFYYIRAYFDDIILTHRHGLAAAEADDDPHGTASMNNYLASALVRTGNHRAALAHVTRAVAICEREGDSPNLFRYRANLLVVYLLRGDVREAVAVGLECLRDPRGRGGHDISVGLPNVGLALAASGRYQEALRIHRLHLYWARVSRNYFHILNALSHVAEVRRRLGEHHQAVRLLRASLALRDRTGHRYAEAEVRNSLGAAYRALGRLEEAQREHETARGLASDSGERYVEAAALNELGRTLAVAGRADEAAEMYAAGLRIATRIAHPYEQGRALAGLAEHFARTDPAEARRHWERALAIFRRMGVPERFDVERRLADGAVAAPHSR